ncbi:MAG: tetratricopeptide repeat protein [Ruminococcus sp.]|nr:tetratricopeptide repeat protein [Ruminococcus sp.]
MNRCDFYSIMQIITQYISEAKALNQTELLFQLFNEFANQNDDFDFDQGRVNRWFRGKDPISPTITRFYLQDGYAEYLASDLEEKIFPLMTDIDKVAQEIYDLLMNDISVSDHKKSELTELYPSQNFTDTAGFISSVLLFGMERKSQKRETKLLMNGTLSPVAADLIMSGSVPNPCKHFCGRENEIAELHTLLETHSKIFITGLAGIGKSEFAKAYAKKYKSQYTNILYFTYPGSLQALIEDIDFADDLPTDDNTTRFKKHNRFLRSLKPDTLLIIDNFNTTAANEPQLDLLMKYNCKILFTTRSRFEVGYTYELNEISDLESLVSLTAYFYTDTPNQRPTVESIIETVHRHTLAVEMSARLMQTGILEPSEILSKLSESSAAPEASDKISITKDGHTKKATYHNHIKTLFSLFSLSDEMQSVMRYATFIPTYGIRARLLAKLISLETMDTINDLIELGFIQNPEMDRIALHPLVQETIISDLCPDTENCRQLLDNIHRTCLQHGVDIPYYSTLFAITENIADKITICDKADYLLFVEDAFAYMEKYRYASGMKKLVSVMSDILSDDDFGTPNDCALLLNNQASCEGLLNGNYKKAIDLEKRAINMCDLSENPLLAANLHMNLGYLYQAVGKTDLAKPSMEKAMQIIAEVNAPTHDFIIMSRNYARLLAETGEARRAITALQKCADFVKATNSETTSDYADLLFDIAGITSQIDGIQAAEHFFIKAFKIYRAVLPDDDLREKAVLAIKYFQRAGVTKLPNYLALE